MVRHRGRFFAFALSALVGLMASEARAGTLTVVLTWPGHTLTISGGPFATLTATPTGETLTFNVGPLNTFLASNGSALQFSSGSGASDNQSVATSASGALLTSNGNMSVIQGSAGSTTMTIDAFKTDWNVPSGSTGTLMNSGSATFGLTQVGDTETYNSWYNNNNAPNGKVLGAGLQTYTSDNSTLSSPPGSPAGSTSAAISPFVTPFSVTNETVITLTATGKTGENGQYQVQTNVNAVPEPASMVMFLTGMPLPLVVVGLLRRRRRAAA